MNLQYSYNVLEIQYSYNIYGICKNKGLTLNKSLTTTANDAHLPNDYYIFRTKSIGVDTLGQYQIQYTLNIPTILTIQLKYSHII